MARGLFTESILAQSAGQRAELWRVREDTTQMEQQYQLTFHFDVSLPIVTMQGYIEQVRTEMAAAFGQVKLWIFGHLADGNLHIGVWGDIDQG